jgi:ribose transport system permease protein
LLSIALNATPLILLLGVMGYFGWQSDKFLTGQNLLNVLQQASGTTIAAVGMTIVLLAAGVDLGVGSVMMLAVAVAGKLVFDDWPFWIAASAAMGVGLTAGLINALSITVLRVIPFIATLAMLFIARGIGLWLTDTRAMNMPESVTSWGQVVWQGVSLPTWIAAAVAISAHLVLTRTTVGRHLYAVGGNPAAARKAGIRTERVVALAYLACGACAALSGLVSLTQTGAVSPSFGERKEFTAIAAAVLGGTSLFGGRGNVLPGTVLGAVLIQTIENGLVILNADPYLHPLITSGIIFVAVLIDSWRNWLVRRLQHRPIYVTTP